MKDAWITVAMLFMVLILVYDHLSPDDENDPRMSFAEKLPLLAMLVTGVIALNGG